MKVRLGSAGVPTVSKERSTLAGIQTVKELGLQALEVEFVRGVHMSNRLAKQAGQLAKKLGIELSVHAPYYINLCNPEKQKASIFRIMQSVERANYLGAEVVVFHPGYYGKSVENAKKMVIQACQEMAKKIKSKAWKVKLGLETTGKRSQIGTLEETAEICKIVPGCVPVVDWAHIYARQGGKIDFGAIFDALKLKHMHTHFSCIEYSEKGERRHLILDTKKPDYSLLVKEILKRKPDITLISESPVLEQDALKMKKMFEKAGYKF